MWCRGWSCEQTEPHALDSNAEARQSFADIRREERELLRPRGRRHVHRQLAATERSDLRSFGDATPHGAPPRVPIHGCSGTLQRKLARFPQNVTERRRPTPLRLARVAHRRPLPRRKTAIRCRVGVLTSFRRDGTCRRSLRPSHSLKSLRRSPSPDGRTVRRGFPHFSAGSQPLSLSVTARTTAALPVEWPLTARVSQRMSHGGSP